MKIKRGKLQRRRAHEKRLMEGGYFSFTAVAFSRLLGGGTIEPRRFVAMLPTILSKN